MKASDPAGSADWRFFLAAAPRPLRRRAGASACRWPGADTPSGSRRRSGGTRGSGATGRSSRTPPRARPSRAARPRTACASRPEKRSTARVALGRDADRGLEAADELLRRAAATLAAPTRSALPTGRAPASRKAAATIASAGGTCAAARAGRPRRSGSPPRRRVAARSRSCRCAGARAPQLVEQHGAIAQRRQRTAEEGGGAAGLEVDADDARGAVHAAHREPVVRTADHGAAQPGRLDRIDAVEADDAVLQQRNHDVDPAGRQAPLAAVRQGRTRREPDRSTCAASEPPGRCRDERRRRRPLAPSPAHFEVGIVNSAPLGVEAGQRCITLFCRV